MDASNAECSRSQLDSTQFCAQLSGSYEDARSVDSSSFCALLCLYSVTCGLQYEQQLMIKKCGSMDLQHRNQQTYRTVHFLMLYIHAAGSGLIQRLN